MKGESADATQAYMLFERAVAGYQQMVNSGADVQKLLDDAIRARRAVRFPALIQRCQMFLASVGLGRSKPLHLAAVRGDLDLAIV